MGGEKRLLYDVCASQASGVQAISSRESSALAKNFDFRGYNGSFKSHERSHLSMHVMNPHLYKSIHTEYSAVKHWILQLQELYPPLERCSYIIALNSIDAPCNSQNVTAIRANVGLILISESLREYSALNHPSPHIYSQRCVLSLV